MSNNINMKNIIIVLFLLFFTIFTGHASESRKEIVSRLFKSIEKWFGTSYKLGGKSKDGIDCSSFVAQIYKEAFNIDLPRRVSQQKTLGTLVKGTLQPGDIIFFKINDSISHVGIYLFNNKFVHAASSGPETGVVKSSLKEKYYKTKFAFAKRFITLPGFNKTNKSNIKNNINENNNTNNENKNEILIGKEVYKDKLFNISNKFNIKEPIYIQITISNKHDKLFLKIFNDQINKKIELHSPVDKKLIQIINLKEGSYKIQICDNNENVILKENILVK